MALNTTNLNKEENSQPTEQGKTDSSQVETPIIQETNDTSLEQKPENRKSQNKCRVCSQPAANEHTLVFALDIGFGWAIEKVHLCESHAEKLDDSDVDKLYVKNRLAHLTRVRQIENKAIPPKATPKEKNTPKSRKQRQG